MAGKEEETSPAPGVGSDKLILRGLQFHGFHGVKQEEKTLGQKFLVDVEAWMDLAAAGASDDIADTVSYTDIYKIAKDVLEGPPYNLVESVAELITNSTLLKFPQISAVRVKVGKPHIAVEGIVDYLGVEIMRIAKGVLEGPPHNLLESVAESITNATLLKFPQISAVRVKVGKPHVAVQGVVDYLGVEIMRYRKA